MKVLVLILFFLISFKTYADSTCIGKVKELAIGRTGTVLIAGPGGYQAHTCVM